MPVGKQQNLKVSYQFLEFISSSNRAIFGHLYKFTSATGATDFFTDLDIDVTNFMGTTWKSNSLRFDGIRRKVAIGLQVDEQSVKIWAAPTDTLFGANFLTGALNGLLDGALVQRITAVWHLVTGNAAIDVAGQSPIAWWTDFTGFVSTLDKGGASHVEVKLKSPLVKLDINMPRNYYQPGCLWNLFDVGEPAGFNSGCTLSRSFFMNVGIVGTGPTAITIPVQAGLVALGADGIPNYAQGRIIFTSGVNNNVETLIDTNDGNNLYLAYPLLTPPSPGDTFQFWVGCSKSFTTCDLKFNNKNNFRGFDKVPPVHVSL